MSSHQYEKYQERHQNEKIASYLGITYTQYISLNPSKIQSQGEFFISYLIEFQAEIPEALSRKIKDLNGNQVEIPSPIIDEEEDYEN
ncbi:hypothetical protein [Comamonas sp.]|uniref:hypothetical protein n=1 Tax=Comamonas sp. TaxID=34028 RepID=UPI003A9564EC